MDIKKQIVSHLVKKYSPVAILLTGSRAKGYDHKGSDWDIIILTKDKDLYVGELFKGEELDTHLRDIRLLKNNVLSNKWAPYSAIEVMYDNSRGKVDTIIKATAKAFKKGPAPLSRAAYEARKNFDRRKVAKLKTLLDNQNGFFEYLGIFFNAVLTHWFELKQQWPIDPVRALDYIKKHDEKFFTMLSILSGSHPNSKKLKTVEQINAHLFKH